MRHNRAPGYHPAHMLPDRTLATALLARACSGDELATTQLSPLLYEELRKIADHLLRNERVGHTLQPTALAHEAYLRLIDQARLVPGQDDAARARFLGIAARAMRRILIDHARGRATTKRRARPMDVQVLSRPEGPLAMPGGRYTFNNWRGQKTQVAPGSFVYTADPKTNAGAYGNSYMQFVTWDDNGPVAEGILSYGQSSNPAHPNFSDQTRKYSVGEWVKLPYTDAQIKADPNFKEMKLSQ